MKYNAPYGAPGANDPYINGNPATGTMGSIPPAASIEFPQREIVNLIAAAGLTPDNADLSQLLEAMKRIDVFNVFKAAVNSGSASQWSAAVASLPTMPPPAGTTIWFKPNYDSVVGGALFSVNGSAFAPVTHPDLVPMGLGDVHASAWLLLFFDGTHWQIIAGANRVVGSAATLQKNTFWYVNGSVGDDTNYDGTSATVQSATVGPFKTISRAAAEVLKYNMNGYDQTVNVANGTYIERVVCGQLNGSGTVHFIGNVATPASVSVSTSILGGCPFVQMAGNYSYEGFRLSNSGSAYDGFAMNAGNATIQNLQFGPVMRYHISCEYGGYLTIVGGSKPPIVIEAGGNAQSHIWVGFSGTMSRAQLPPDGAALSILGAVNFYQAFISVGNGGVANFFYGNGISGGGNATGPKFYTFGNGVIICGQGLSHFPGSVAGSVTTGGQYL
jgi:hypothetical protein